MQGHRGVGNRQVVVPVLQMLLRYENMVRLGPWSRAPVGASDRRGVRLHHWVVVLGSSRWRWGRSCSERFLIYRAVYICERWCRIAHPGLVLDLRFILVLFPFPL